MNSIFKSMGASGAAFNLKNVLTELFEDLREYLNAQGIDIPVKWLPVLKSLSDGQCRTIGQLANELSYSHVAVVKLIKDMNSAEEIWIEIIKDESDRRKKIIGLSDLGIEKIEMLLPALESYSLKPYLKSKGLNPKLLLFAHN